MASAKVTSDRYGGLTDGSDSLAIEAAEIGTWDYYPRTGRLHWSRLTKALHGLPEDVPVTYDAFLASIHPDDRARVRDKVGEALDPKSSGAYAITYRCGAPGGPVRWLNVRGRVFFDRGRRPTRFIGTTQDVTAEKTAEEKLRELTRDLARSNADLDQFAAFVSHDLKQPIRMVHNYLRLLAERELVEPSEGQEYLQWALDGASQMKLLIERLYEYSRVGQSVVSLRPVELARPLRAALMALRVLIEETEALITHSPLPRVRGDETLLVDVFQHLIANAIQFRRDEKPRVNVGAEKQGDRWVIHIGDNGTGFPAEDAERIFVIFQRLQDPPGAGGTGVGLALSKRIVERLGGRIWAHSEPGKGSTFFFTLPAVTSTGG